MSSNSNYEALKNSALEGVIYRMAHLTCPIYPMKTVNAKGETVHERTPWEEGWNKCHRALSEKVDVIKAWLKIVPDLYKTRVEEYLINHVIWLRVDEGRVMMEVDCSDLFLWGCSDAEEITFKDIYELDACFVLTKFGGELWCCRKRQMRPQAAVYEAYLPCSDHKLFDDAGPERDDPDGRKPK